MKKLSSFFLRVLRVVLVLAIAVGLAKLLISLKKEPEKKEIVRTPPSVTVISAIPVSKVMTLEAFGVVKPRKRVRIAGEVPGRIVYVHPSFVEGGALHQGDLLVRIDQRSYLLDRQAGQVRIRQAVTEIDSLRQEIENLKIDGELSRANAGLARQELKRINALNKNQFASKNSRDKAEQQYLQAKIGLQNINNRLALTDTLMEQKKAALAMAHVEFQKADLALQKTAIKADFNGLILEKSAEVGDYITPGQTLGTIYQEGLLEVDVSIPMEKMKWIGSFFEEGKTPKAKVMVPGLEEAAPYVWEARIAQVKAEIDEKTRTLPMTLEILTPGVKIKNGFELKPGAFVNCCILGDTHTGIYVLPRHLLKSGNILFTVDNNQLKMKKVTVLRKFEEEVYISSGLTPGDEIISSPLPGAREGMALTIRQNGK